MFRRFIEWVIGLFSLAKETKVEEGESENESSNESDTEYVTDAENNADTENNTVPDDTEDIDGKVNFIKKTRTCNIQRFFSAVKIEKFRWKNFDIFNIFCSKH